jgi:uncharacterized protein YjbI with pentapeptide repeats
MKHCALLSCGRPALADPQAQGYCILHAPWDGKDLSAFQAAIDEIIEKARQGSGVCDFSHCYFPVNYDCRDLEQAFEFHCNFYGSKFAGYADFNQVKFSEGAIFWKAEFFGVVAFTGAKFSKSAVFEEAKFSKDAYFTGAEFSGDAVFWRANFSENAYFWGVKFFEYATFEEAKFSGNTHFEGAEFRQRADFYKVETAKNATVNFQGVKLLKPQQVFFHHVDLSRWSFLDTDLRRIDFNDVTWGTIPSISPLRSRRWIRRWERRHLSRRFLLRLLRLRLRLTPTRTALFDEIRVSKEKVKKARLAKVERLYRHLKQNYESQRDYGRAGDFYYGEMEMKRRQLNPLGQIPFWIYRILSGYGESYPRALFWLIVMWLLFAVLFTVVGYTDEWGNHADLWRSLIYSAQSMTLFHELNITFHSAWGKAIKLVASVLGVIQIALFGLALQRRFKR